MIVEPAATAGSLNQRMSDDVRAAAVADWPSGMSWALRRESPALRDVMAVLEPQDFSVLDVENLRLHYVRTLECWLERYERSFDWVTERFGPAFARMWRLYLAGSIAGFQVGTLQLFQLVFAGRACNTLPWTRANLYNNSTRETVQDVECIRAMS